MMGKPFGFYSLLLKDKQPIPFLHLTYFIHSLQEKGYQAIRTSQNFLLPLIPPSN